MNVINFHNPVLTQAGYSLLLQCLSIGFSYEQSADHLKRIGYYVPEDQFNAFNDVLNIMMDLDIGSRQEEFKAPEDIMTNERYQAETDI